MSIKPEHLAILKELGSNGVARRCLLPISYTAVLNWAKEGNVKPYNKVCIEDAIDTFIKERNEKRAKLLHHVA